MFLPDRSRIFNHKGGLQIPSNPVLQYPSQQQNQAPIYNQGYMQIPQQQVPVTQQEVQPIYRSPIITPQGKNSINLHNHNLEILPDQLMMPPNWQQPQQPIQQYVMPAATKVQTLPQVPVQQQPESIPPPSDVEDDNSTELPKKKQRKHKKVDTVEKKDDSKAHADNDPVHEQYKMIRDSLEVEFKDHKMEFRDHDGKSDRPEGALLSLSLGLLITAVLAIIVTCRMKVVGSRRRTGKVPFGRDADFLVNGMYL